MSKDRNIDDAELANISGAGGGNVHVEATPDVPGADSSGDPGTKPGAGDAPGPGSVPTDADTGGDHELGRN